MKFHPYSIGAVDCSFNDNVYNFNYMHPFTIKMVEDTWEVSRYCKAEEADEHVITFHKDMTVDELVTLVTPTCPTATHLFVEIIKTKYRNYLTRG